MQQLLWKQTTMFGVGTVTAPSLSDPTKNVTYFVAKFDVCVNPSDVNQNIGSKRSELDMFICKQL